MKELNSTQPNKKKKRKKRSALKNVLIVLISLLVFAAIAFCFIAFAVTNNGRIFPNVVIEGINVGGMTEEQALSAMRSGGWSEKEKLPIVVHTAGDISFEIDPLEVGATVPAQQLVDEAVAVGHDGNIFDNLRSYIRCTKEKTIISAPAPVYNEEYLTEKIAECAKAFSESMGQESYHIDLEKGEVVFVKGFSSANLDTVGLLKSILTALDSGEKEVTYDKVNGQDSMPDFQSIYDEVYVEMKDASFSTDGSHEILPEQTGRSFDLEEAIEKWSSAAIGDEIVIPITETEPEVTEESLRAVLFHDLLGACTTKYNNSGANRSNNVRLAASKIDDIVVYPGETFSFNQTVGKRTTEAGFLPATAYAGVDSIADEVGGGVCQVSTTLYAAVLFSFLEVTDHTCHLYPPNYIQLGMDTTVTIPDNGREVDFKFKNNKNYPILIRAFTYERPDGGPYKTITVEIYGTLEEDDYMPIEFDNSVKGLYDYDRVIDPSYEDREGYKIKFTYQELGEFEDEDGTGIRTYTHRLVYNSEGELVEDTIINRAYDGGYVTDYYYYRNYDS